MTAIRQASAADLDRLLELDGLFWAERQAMLAPDYRHTEAPMPRETMLERLSGRGFRTFVAELHGEVISYLVAKVSACALPDGRTEREGRVCDLFVLGEHRRQGIASSLYAAATRWFDEEQCESEGLTVYTTNPALELYRHWGFDPFSLNLRRRRSPMPPSRRQAE